MTSASNVRFIEGEEEVKCPFCAEWVKAEAKVCKHCGRDIAVPIAEFFAAEAAREHAATEAASLAAEAQTEASRVTAEAEAEEERIGAESRAIEVQAYNDRRAAAIEARRQALRRLFRKKSTWIAGALAIVVVIGSVFAVEAQIAANHAQQLATARLAAHKALATVPSYTHPSWTDVAAAEARLQEDSATLNKLEQGSDIKAINSAIGNIDSVEKQISTPAQERQRVAVAAAAAKSAADKAAAAQAAAAAAQAAATAKAAEVAHEAIEYAAARSANVAAANTILSPWGAQGPGTSLESLYCQYSGASSAPRDTYTLDHWDKATSYWNFYSTETGKFEVQLSFSEETSYGAKEWLFDQVEPVSGDAFNNLVWNCHGIPPILDSNLYSYRGP